MYRKGELLYRVLGIGDSRGTSLQEWGQLLWHISGRSQKRSKLSGQLDKCQASIPVVMAPQPSPGLSERESSVVVNI
nr:hypothetical protein Q903MT_gene1757 [Picea sitchensis]